MIDEDATLAAENEAIKHQLKRLRANRGLSLQQLATISGVSIGLLSQIERGRSSPSLRTLTKIRIALEVPMTDLFAPPETVDKTEGRFVVRQENRNHLDIGPNKLIKELLSPPGYKFIQSMILMIPPGGGSGSEPYQSQGEKAGLVLNGFFRLFVSDDVFDLRKGDSFQFDSSKPHRFENKHSETAEVLWIVYETINKKALSEERHLNGHDADYAVSK